MYYRIALFLYLIAVTSCKDSRSPKIAIVGAGASGIAAASKLLENGFQDLLILEAEDRIGGRVHSIRFDDYMIDMGGQWIHGEKDNAAYALAAPLNLIEHSVKFGIHMYASTGELINSEIVTNLTDTYFTYEFDTPSVLKSINCSISLGDCLEKKFREHFLNFPELNETMQEDLLWHFNLMQTSWESADSWYDISLGDYEDYDTDVGDLAMNWKERTYSTILDILMKRFPNPDEELPVMNKTILNAEVTKVDYSNDDDTVKLTTVDGREYVVDHVIMTPSLGVLKAQHETLFNPPLLESKIRVIKGLGFGSGAKIYLAFNDTWPQSIRGGARGLCPLWNKEETLRLSSNPKTSWMPFVQGFYKVEHKPRLMLIWVSGKGGRLMANVTDDEVFEQTVQMLNDFFSKDYNVSRPTAMIRTKWQQNKHFRGLYSFRSVETDIMNVSASQLAEPITKMGRPVVLFGGEATNTDQYATVHGAISSGWREAERLMGLYSKNSTIESST